MNNRCGVQFIKIKEPVQMGPVFTRRRKLEILTAEAIAFGIDQTQAGGIADDSLRRGNGPEFCQADIEILFDRVKSLFDEKIKQKTLDGILFSNTSFYRLLKRTCVQGPKLGLCLCIPFVIAMRR